MSSAIAAPLRTRLLRAVLHRGSGRLRRPVATSLVVTGARLAEMVLAEQITDRDGNCAVTARLDADAATDGFTSRVAAMSGCPWNQLYLRTGLDPRAVLRTAIDELVATGTWRVKARRFRAVENRRYLDDTYAHPQPTDPFGGEPREDIARAVLDSLYLIQAAPMDRPLSFDTDPTRLLHLECAPDTAIGSSLRALLTATHDAESWARSPLNLAINVTRAK
jgi:hypothetical protein